MMQTSVQESDLLNLGLQAEQVTRLWEELQRLLQLAERGWKPLDIYTV